MTKRYKTTALWLKLSNMGTEMRSSIHPLFFTSCQSRQTEFAQVAVHSTPTGSHFTAHQITNQVSRGRELHFPLFSYLIDLYNTYNNLMYTQYQQEFLSPCDVFFCGTLWLGTTQPYWQCMAVWCFSQLAAHTRQQSSNKPTFHRENREMQNRCIEKSNANNFFKGVHPIL